MPGTVQAVENTANSPASVMQPSVENNEYYRMEKELQNRGENQGQSNVVDNTQGASAGEGSPSNLTIWVNKIDTDPSSILSTEEVTAIIAKYEGRMVGIQDLYQAVKEINDLYLKKGFITAKAVLAPQKVADGIVRIQLVEGHFGRFILQGNESTRSRYILDRLSEHSGDLVNMHTLERDVFYFNRTNDVQLRAELRPGQFFGQTDCVLKVGEPKNLQGTLFSDNEGALNTGAYRFGLNIVDNSLFGNRDTLFLSPIGSNGTWAGSASYSTPIDTQGTRLSINYNKNQSNVISGPFQSLDICSHETATGFEWSRPMRVEASYKLDGFMSVYNKKTGTDFSGSTMVTSGVRTYAAGVALQTLDNKGFWYSRYDVTRILRDDHGQDSMRYNVTAVRQQALDQGRVMIYRLTGQLTDGKLLPSTEEFSIGGMSTVRGYSSSYLSGDEGYDFSMEYDFPVRFSKKVTGLAFFDNGGAFAYKGNGQGIDHRDFLTSVGFGATINFSPATSGKLVFGFPIDPPLGQKHLRIEYFMQSILF